MCVCEVLDKAEGNKECTMFLRTTQATHLVCLYEVLDWAEGDVVGLRHLGWQDVWGLEDVLGVDHLLYEHQPRVQELTSAICTNNAKSKMKHSS